MTNKYKDENRLCVHLKVSNLKFDVYTKYTDFRLIILEGIKIKGAERESLRYYIKEMSLWPHFLTCHSLHFEEAKCKILYKIYSQTE